MSDSNDDDTPLVNLIPSKKLDKKKRERKYSADEDKPLGGLLKSQVSSDDDDTPLVHRLSKIQKTSNVRSIADASTSLLSLSKRKNKNHIKVKQPKIKKEETDEEYSENEDTDNASDDDSIFDLNIRKPKKMKTFNSEVITDYIERDVYPLHPENEFIKWWPSDQLPLDTGESNEIKWKTFRHNGVIFPPEYQAHSVKMLYENKPIYLTPEQEEPATWFAAILESPYTTNPIFRRNFFQDWKKILGADHVIKTLDKCDFSPIFKYLQEEKEKKIALRKDKKYKVSLPVYSTFVKANNAKEEQKAEKQRIMELYGYAIIDSVKEKVGNYTVEPPGLFRGSHPLAGKIKKRIMPEDVILNIGKNEEVPKCPMANHRWGGIVHNNDVVWLACWHDSIFDHLKYVQLSSSGRFKGMSDFEKYQLARKLRSRIKFVRDNYAKELKSKDIKISQRATALWLIDHLALRVGNEKDLEEAADTCGCCNLRVEHIKLNPNYSVIFDFLGKDSMRYLNEVAVDEEVYENLQRFIANKSKNDLIFDQLSTFYLNKHLKTLMPGLTVKVFRTFNASFTLQDEFNKRFTASSPITLEEKLLEYHMANREVAVLCNHQRTIPKGYEKSLEKIDNKMDKLSSELAFLNNWLSGQEKKAADTPNDFKIPSSKEKCSHRISVLNSKIKKIQNEQKIKGEDFKAISLVTSKKNYIDPRIITVFCKKYSIPIEKIFSKSLLAQFPWSLDVTTNWIF